MIKKFNSERKRKRVLKYEKRKGEIGELLL